MYTLTQANENLSKLYGPKHKHITIEEIQAVYTRDILSINADAKTSKGAASGYMTGILYLAPSNLSGVNLCPKASEGCKAACLFTAGRGAMYSVTRARMVKTLAWLNNKDSFLKAIRASIQILIAKASLAGQIPVVRLNGTSDIMWEGTGIMAEFPNVQFYDYTKLAFRFFKDLPKNYHLTFSLSESNKDDAAKVMLRGGNVAAVFRSMPTVFMGRPVIDADNNDLRFLDPKGTIAGLKPKGRAKLDRSGFVQ